MTLRSPRGFESRHDHKYIQVMTLRKHQYYTLQFKAETVELVIGSGMSTKQAATIRSVSVQSLNTWLKEYRGNPLIAVVKKQSKA